VALARRAGAVVLGKTVTTEFAFFAPGKTRNPTDLSRTPGGSSSGSAAAVADRMVPFAFGTQTAGSVIRPAAFCGVVGFKPSFGRMPRSGVLPFAESLDTLGTLARTVEDAATLAAVASRRAHWRAAPTAHPRIGVYRSHQWDAAAPESRAAVERAARILDEAGAEVSMIPPLDALAGLVDGHAVVMAFEAALSFSHEYETARAELSSELVGLIERGLATPPARRDQALQDRDTAAAELALTMRHLDALLTVSVIGEAPEGLSSTGDPLFNRTWTFLGTPALHLPGFAGPNGMPVGVQLVGAARRDVALLGVASWAETLLGK
jgi:Asp-tRNA(Asn)/Glu-tRNA(Gln) amidotransferase A subunit family amidase